MQKVSGGTVEVRSYPTNVETCVIQSLISNTKIIFIYSCGRSIFFYQLIVLQNKADKNIEVFLRH